MSSEHQKILVLNAGSSSVKYQLFHARDLHVLASGMVEEIGHEGCKLKHVLHSPDSDQQQKFEQKSENIKSSKVDA